MTSHAKISLDTTRVMLREDCGITLRRGGAGPTVLILHGAGGAASCLDLAQSLAASCDVLLPEHPGFDTSDDPDWIDSVDDLAYLYLDLFRLLKMQKVHLVGHSLGGWIAAEIAIRSTANLSALTLISSAGLRVKDEPPGDNFLWSREEAAERLYVSPALRESALAAPVTVESQLAQLKNRRASAKLSWSPRWYNPRLARWLRRIDVPAQIIWGDSDGLFPPSYAAEFARLIPSAKAVVLPRCGHVPQLEHPAEVRSAILRMTGQLT